jgi:tetratricopeptide (TPR) repeat protein
MTLHDSLGLALSGASADSLPAYARAMAELQAFVGDPVGSANKAIAAAPDFVMAHVFKGYLYALSTEPKAARIAEECARLAAGLAADGRERRHVEALRLLAGGGWHAAGRLLGEISADHPRDILALQAGHQIDFFTGNAASLRARIATALPAWDAGMPGYHSVLGMRAFGLEENAEYSEAEAAGRRAVELEPRNGWAQHAVAHVMEMQCRQREGIGWMRANPDAWATESFLQVHNWWHLALFHYDLGETDEILALYDGPIYGAGSTLALNMVDASSLLWRLHLGGADVGDRWQELADNWLPLATAGNYAFNDAHAMMAFVGAGREEAARTLLAAQEEATRRDDDNAAFTRDVGHPLAQAIHAFGRGQYTKAAELILPIRAIASRFGGSHAQRDVIELTLIETAIRAGDHALALRLTREREKARHDSPLSGVLRRRAEALHPAVI